MKMEEDNFDIHGILSLNIVRSRLQSRFKDIFSPFSWFRRVNEPLDSPNVILQIMSFDPVNMQCYSIDHKYHVKRNYLYCKDSEGGIGWKVEITGFEDGFSLVRFSYSLFNPLGFLIGDILPQYLILKPLIEYKLSKINYVLLHAAGVVHQNNAYIFAGRGGTFKTRLTLDFINSGFDYLGDDTIILSETSQVLCFPSPLPQLHFALLSGRLPDETSSERLDKARFVKYILKDSKRIASLNVPIVNSGTLKFLFIIRRTNMKRRVTIRPLSLEGATRSLVENNRLESIESPVIFGRKFGRYYKYMLTYSFVFPDSYVATYWDRLDRMLKKILGRTKIYEMNIPWRYNFEAILEALNTML